MSGIYLTFKFDVSDLTAPKRISLFPSDGDLLLVSQVVTAERIRCEATDDKDVYFVEIEAGDVEEYFNDLYERAYPTSLSEVVSLVNCDVDIRGAADAVTLGGFWNRIHS